MSATPQPTPHPAPPGDPIALHTSAGRVLVRRVRPAEALRIARLFVIACYAPGISSERWVDRVPLFLWLMLGALMVEQPPPLVEYCRNCLAPSNPLRSLPDRALWLVVVCNADRWLLPSIVVALASNPAPEVEHRPAARALAA